MKTLDEVVANLRARGIDPHRGKLVLHPANIEMAKQAVTSGIAIAISKDASPGKATFFPDASLKRVIRPEDEEYKAWLRGAKVASS